MVIINIFIISVIVDFIARHVKSSVAIFCYLFIYLFIFSYHQFCYKDYCNHYH